LNENRCTLTNAEDEVVSCEYDGNNNGLYIVDFIDCLSFDEDDNKAVVEEVCLHDYTAISTAAYSTDLLNLLRGADISKSHSKRLISLIKSGLPIPNHLPSTLDDLLSFMNVENLFSRRSICLICKQSLEYKHRKCLTCESVDEMTIADIYDLH